MSPREKAAGAGVDAPAGATPLARLLEGHSRLAAELLILLALAVYAPAFGAGTFWDDRGFLFRNPLIKASDGLYRFWFTSGQADYFPLTSSMLWFEWRLFGERPAGYHAVNIALHALSALLLWRVLERLKVPGAWFAALVWALHPVNAESVCWISERKNTLSQALFMASLLAFLRFEDRPGRGGYLASLGLFLLALLSKTSAVALAPALLLCAWWRRGKVAKRDLVRVAAFFAAAVAMGLVTIWFQHHRAAAGAPELLAREAPWTRVAAAGQAVWFYLYKAALPINLAIIYPRWTAGHGASAWLPLALLAGCFAVFAAFRRSWGRPFLFGLGYYVLALGPTLGIIPMTFMIYSRVSDHFQYLALPGVAALAAGGAWRVVAGRKRMRVAAALAAVVATAALFTLTWRQAGVYRTEESAWREVVRMNPACRPAWTNLGTTLMEAGRLSEAEEIYRKVVREHPDQASARHDLGYALAAAGRFDEAAREYAEAVRIRPDYFEAHYGYADALQRAGRAGDAAEQYREAVRCDPESFEARYGLGGALMAAERADEAIAVLTEAVRLRPDRPEGYCNLAEALLMKERRAEAEASYEKALAAARAGGMIETAGAIEQRLAMIRAGPVKK